MSIASGASAAPDVRPIPTLGLTEEECRSFSIIRAVRALAYPDIRESASFELEVSRAAAQAMGKEPRGIIIPQEVLDCTLGTSKDGIQGNPGGYLAATDYRTQSFIQTLCDRTVAMRLGWLMTGLVGDFEIPHTGGYWAGYWDEDRQTAPETVPSYSSKIFSPRTVGALVPITFHQLMQPSLDAEALIRADLAAALGETIDKAVFYGTGSKEEPCGLSRIDGVNVVRLASPGKPTYDELIEMEAVTAAPNAATKGMTYVLSSRVRSWLKTAQKFEGTNGAPIWEPGDTVNGYRAETTNQVEPNDIFFGVFSDLMIGLWGGLEIPFDSITRSVGGGAQFIASQGCDFLVRRPESFCLAR